MRMRADLSAFFCDSAVLIDCLVKLNFSGTCFTGERVRKLSPILYVACVESGDSN